MKIECAGFKFTIKALETLHLPPYKGSTFRGAFGTHFKRIVCVNPAGCKETCAHPAKCVYSWIFETPSLKNEGTRKYTYIPHPFVLEPPLTRKTAFKDGDAIAFGLVLFGKAMQYLPYFIYTFDQLGKMGIGKGRGKFFLESVANKGIDGSESIVYHGDEKVLKNVCDEMTFERFLNPWTEGAVSETRKIKLRFQTPFRVKVDGNFTDTISFSVFFTALFRRLSLLSEFYGNTNGTQEIKMQNDASGAEQELLKKAEDVKVLKSTLRWTDWERYSARQDTRMKLGGVTGMMECEGNLQDFMPYIKMGCYTHVGKGTSFGLGKYEVE